MIDIQKIIETISDEECKKRGYLSDVDLAEYFGITSKELYEWFIYDKSHNCKIFPPAIYINHESLTHYFMEKSAEYVMDIINGNGYLYAKDAAKFIGKSRSTLLNWYKKNKINRYTNLKNKRFLYKESELILMKEKGSILGEIILNRSEVVEGKLV